MDLRRQADIGDRYRAAAAIGARTDQRFERLESLCDPMAIPRIDGALLLVHLAFEVAERPNVVERVDIAGDDLRKRARLGPRNRVPRKQRRAWMGLVEIFDDSE